jgi:hypothetical protein
MSQWSQGLAATELVWHRANREAELVAFLASGVRWAECDARIDTRGVVRVSHEPLEDTGEGLELDEWLGAIRGDGRSAKIDLKEGGPVIAATLGAVRRVGLRDDDLWFNAAVEVPGSEAGWRRLAEAHPGARLSCPLDTLASYLLLVPPAYEVVDLMGTWGVNWLCFGSRVPGVESLVPAVHERGWPVNIWDVEDADALERALLLAPEAITADLGSIDPFRPAPMGATVLTLPLDIG